MDLKQLKKEARKFGIIYKSPVMGDVLRRAKLAARSKAHVLLTGPTGVGKDRVAKAIYKWSSRKNKPFVLLNCAALPRELFESELFGHLKGAFTGAIKDKKGILEKADGGTVFLNEIGTLDPVTQPKLLSCLDYGTFQQVGAIVDTHVDVRIIAATNADLEKAVEAGTFRDDLYSRLKVVHIEIPPLSSHAKDIPGLVDYFVKEVGAEENREVTIIPEARDYLSEQVSYPDNVRGLRNAIAGAIIFTEGTELTYDVFASDPGLVHRQQEMHSPAEIHYCTETIDLIFDNDIERQITERYKSNKKKKKKKKEDEKKPDMKALKHTLNELINERISLSWLRKPENYKAPQFLSCSQIDEFIRLCWEIFNQKCWDLLIESEQKPTATEFLDRCRTACEQRGISDRTTEDNDGNDSL